MDTKSVLVKAKEDITKLKSENNEGNVVVIKYIIGVVKDKCGLLFANQLVEELKLEDHYKNEAKLEALH